MDKKNLIYILYSLKDKNLYVGQTDNIDKRLVKHKKGEVKSTKERRPLKLIYVEQFRSRSIAMKREKFLKSLYGAKIKKKILQNYLKQNTPR